MSVKTACLFAALCVSVEIHVQTSGTIKGVVVDEQDKPVPKAKVQLVPAPLGAQRRLIHFYETDSEGRFVIGNVTWGTYRVFAGKEEVGYPEIAGTFYGLQAFPTVSLHPSSPAASITIHLPPKAGAIKSISVIDAVTGAQMDSAAIWLRRDAVPDASIETSTMVKRILVPSNTDVSIQIKAPRYKAWPADEDPKDRGHIRLKPEEAVRLDVKLAPDGSNEDSVALWSPTTLGVVSEPANLPYHPSDAILSTAVDRFSVAAGGISGPLEALAVLCRVPIGFEASRNTKPKSVRIDIQTGTVRDVLNAITAEDPVYTWSESHFGVINVYPKNHTGSLPDVVVATYSVKNADRETAIDELKRAPQVEHWLRQTGANLQAPQTGPLPTANTGTQFSITLTNSSVRDLLDAITIASGSHYWAFYGHGDHGAFLTLTMAH
ncbi:MAG TPA: carboxypeptidase-like regulatory domain-containing protein [Terriglobia bacterium]|nr:carboxypeptidase-like regulatory domain-containing protein [Terriglobia bacterium]